MKDVIKRGITFAVKIFVNILYWKSINYFAMFIKNVFISEWYKNMIKTCGKGSTLGQNLDIVGGEFISIGKNTTINNNISITAWSAYNEQRFNPIISIGNNCGIGERAHITAINCITIGNGVLLGKNVLITDNAHGDNSLIQQSIIPSMRPLKSKGPVFIEDNVWIGQNVCILPGVRIGNGAVVAANSVVTVNVDANTVVGGIPSKLIRKIN